MTDPAALLARTLAAIEPADTQAAAAAQRALDHKTKPHGSLGRLELVACRIAGIRGAPTPDALRGTVVVAVADHGIAAEGVSAYPQQVTRQMLANFASGGAAINVLARLAELPVIVVDAGVAEPIADPAIRSFRLGPGTANSSTGPAMSRGQALAGIGNGIALANELAGDGFGLVALGEMGIANTTAASALAAALLRLDPTLVCGRGTGIDEQQLSHKIGIVRRALAVNEPQLDDPVGVLAAVGGFEIATLAGVTLGAAAQRIVVLLDGFITGAAALVAAALAPNAVEYMIASHRSPEPGHAHVLGSLGLEPLLDLGLRLGEGTGAVLSVPLIRASLAVLNEMATFEQAGVTDAGR